MPRGRMWSTDILTDDYRPATDRGWHSPIERVRQVSRNLFAWPPRPLRRDSGRRRPPKKRIPDPSRPSARLDRTPSASIPIPLSRPQLRDSVEDAAEQLRRYRDLGHLVDRLTAGRDYLRRSWALTSHTVFRR